MTGLRNTGNSPLPTPHGSLVAGRIAALEAAVQRAETALSEANERGSRTAIQRQETRLSNPVERLERYRGKGVKAV